MPKVDRNTSPRATKATETPLTAEILGGIVPTIKGPAGWFNKLPRDVQADVGAVREQFAAGKIAATKVSVAKSIHAALSARGLIGVTWKEVVRWLGER